VRPRRAGERSEVKGEGRDCGGRRGGGCVWRGSGVEGGGVEWVWSGVEWSGVEWVGRRVM
jgi:hypothetical protein